MRQALSSQKCESCAGLPPLTAAEVAEFLKDPEVKGWMLANDGTPRINKTFKFEAESESELDKDGWSRVAWRRSRKFVDGMLDFMNEEDHHGVYTHTPAKKGGSVNVILVTHAVRGLSKNDFRMAAKLNKLYEEIG